MQAPITNEMMQQAPEQQVDEITLAKQALGLDKHEQLVQQMQAQMQEANNNAMFKEVSSNYKDVDANIIQEELKKISETNPQMAETLRTNKDGLDMLFKKVIAERKSPNEPDEITDSGDAGVGSIGSDITKKLKDGTATEVELGDFILENA